MSVATANSSSSVQQKPTGMRVSTPELLWHGGGNEHGKPDPVYAVDISANNILATAGIDASVPPRGSVRLWEISSKTEGQEFIVDLCDHDKAVNAVRFSPCGRYLASASVNCIYIYCVHNVSAWRTAGEGRIDRIWLRPSLDEIYDLQWSPDSTHIIVGSIDSNAQIIRLTTSVHNPVPPVPLNGHTSYVQGVAWDPLNQMVATQSADRSVRFHQFNKPKAGVAQRLGIRRSEQVKMLNPLSSKAATPMLIVGDGPNDPASPGHPKGKNLFADSTVPSFFRRPAFSPDGALFIAPTGIYRPSVDKSPSTVAKDLPSSSFCTHIFSREHLSSPIISLAGLEDPSIAVRCSPIVYELIHRPSEKAAVSLIPGDYRFVFAVVSVSSVFIYDTQHSHPIARIGGMHWASINDAAWSADGLLLAVCSSDGYVTFARFAEGSLGIPISQEKLPETIKRTFPSIYMPNEIPTVNPHIVARNASNANSSLANEESSEEVTGTGTKSQVDDSEKMVETTGEVCGEPVSAATSSAAEGDSVKKKRRITPQLVTSAQQSSSSGVMTAPQQHSAVEVIEIIDVIS